MNGRGRPRTPDILTPREYEVLDLLRQGLTNREIADRLSISLAGAKYHVSEIITKLGVSSREEAAAWRREPAPTRRWAGEPFSSFGVLRESLSGWMGNKAATGILLLLAVAGTGTVGSMAFGAREEAGSPRVLKQPVPCHQNGALECRTSYAETLQFTSLLEAEKHTSFKPVLPEYTPPNYSRSMLTYTWPALLPKSHAADFDKKGPRSPYEWLSAQYSTDARNAILAVQGYGFGSTPVLFQEAPDERQGTIHTNDRELRWYLGQSPVPGPWQGKDQIVVFWEVYGPSTGIGWEVSPDGTHREYELRGQPFIYHVIGELPLEEMLNIAASVP